MRRLLILHYTLIQFPLVGESYLYISDEKLITYPLEVVGDLNLLTCKFITVGQLQ